MTIWMIFAIVLTASGVLFALLPLGTSISTGVGGAQGEEVLRLLDMKERSLRALKDLELDFAMGKMSEDDYARSRETVTLEVAQILREIKEHGKQ
jgi:hypothetical protein